MTERTDRFGFDILGPGGSLQDNGFKFGDADRRLLDRLLRLAVEDHVHDGVAAEDRTPSVAPTLTLHTTGGGILAGTRLYYRFTYVDARGNESAASPYATVDTPPAVSDPGAPSPSYVTSGGSLPPGSYQYILSAYTTTDTLETRAVAPIQVLVSSSLSENVLTLAMPSLPAGATGFNVYRQRPNSPRYYYLGSTTGPTFVDDGTTDDNVSRGLPATNTTNSGNAVTIVLPGATPAVPDGYTWKLYRSTTVSNWDNTFLEQIVSGDPTWDDPGATTFTGNPPEVSQVAGSPPKVSLTDMAEVEGQLPPGANVVPYVIHFVHPGIANTTTGTFIWVCEFTRARIVSCRAYLGVDQFPAAQDVIVDVNKYDANAATPSWSTIYTTQANRPHVPQGLMIGDPTEPDIVDLRPGDALTADIDQMGGGVTPTDQNLVIAVLMYVQYGSTTESVDWP